MTQHDEILIQDAGYANVLIYCATQYTNIHMRLTIRQCIVYNLFLSFLPLSSTEGIASLGRLQILKFYIEYGLSIE